MKRLLPTVMIAALAMTCAPAALAQSAEDIATAKAAIVKARALRAEGRLQDALPNFRAAYALVPTPVTGFDYGSTLAELGQLVLAREVLVAATKLPGENTEDEKHRQARAQARALAEQLDARIPSITIALKGVPEGASVHVSVDGQDVRAAALGVPRRVDPGHHTVTARAGDGAQRSVSIDLAERESKVVELDLTPAPSAAPTSEPPGPPPSAPSGDVHAATAAGSRTTLALLVGGAGVVAAGVGAYLNLTGKSSYEDATSHCSNGLCAPADANAASSAATRGTVGMIVMSAGLLAVAGGVVLWLTAPSSPHAASVAVLPGGVALRGAF
jgi:hypothetical protein